MQNPLLKVKFNSWQEYIVSHLLGTNWRNNIWNSATLAVEQWLNTNTNAGTTQIQTFVQTHFDQFINTLTHNNMFLGAILSGILQPLITPMVQELVTFAEAKIAELTNTNPAPPPAQPPVVKPPS